MTRAQEYEFRVGDTESGMRLDVFLAEKASPASRSQVRRWVEQGCVKIAGRDVKAGLKLRAGEVVTVATPEPAGDTLVPEDIPLRILHEDPSLAVVDKPAGMVVHPAAGNTRGTLVHALLHHLRDLSGVGGVLRPGVVHRLDKGTSGVLVVAKDDAAHRGLAEQFKKRQVRKVYRALVYGDVKGDEGTIDLPVGRHPRDRKKMSARSPRGREALTRWRVVERFGVATLLEVEIKTGRTHQIRVHLNTAGHPVVGDATYGGAGRRASVPDRAVREKLGEIQRQALHAGTLGFHHPRTGRYMEFSSPLPGDIERILVYLRERRTKG